MSQVYDVYGANSAQAVKAAKSSISNDRMGSMSTEDFFKVMMTELQNQDPFEPQDSSALIDQISGIRNIESQMTLQESMENLVMQNQIASAGNLIGLMVEGMSANNDKIVGLVTSVRVVDNKVMLELDTGHSLEMSRVSTVTSGNAAAPGAES